MRQYIYHQQDWPNFFWNSSRIESTLATVRHKQGKLLGRMESLGFQLREEAVLNALTSDVIKSSEIEGEILDEQAVRSSIARRLGIDIGALEPADRDVEGVVEMMLDATQKFTEPLTAERLWDWHAALFPTGRSGMHKIRVGNWRDDSTGPMQVVSGPIGKERVHFEAPPATQISDEMDNFLKWFEDDGHDPVLKAGIAHLWFVTIHPFEDGNGRITRAISDLLLARSEISNQRFYSMSAHIRKERKQYYEILEKTTSGTLDITSWLEWFLNCLDGAIDGADEILESVLMKARFWESLAGDSISERQKLVLNRLLNGFQGKLTSSKWAILTKASQDTASRDIHDLLKRGILVKDTAGGRSTSYFINPNKLR